MSGRELVALGTASQVPTRYRNHNAYMLLWDGAGLLFDPGEGTQRQMIAPGLSVSQLQQILITHFHGDHCLGFASIVQRLSLDGVDRQVKVHYPASGQVYFDRLRRASILRDRTQLASCPIARDGVIHEEPAFWLEARALDHGVECFGYRLQEPDAVHMLSERLDALGIGGADRGRLKQEGRLEVAGRTVALEEVSVPRRGQSFAFVMDTRVCDAAIALARDADLLVCESTYLGEHEREARDFGHLTAAHAATIAKEAKAGRLVLTHFSQRYPGVERFVEEAARIHPDVVAAEDGMRIAVPKRPRPQSTDQFETCVSSR